MLMRINILMYNCLIVVNGNELGPDGVSNTQRPDGRTTSSTFHHGWWSGKSKLTDDMWLNL